METLKEIIQYLREPNTTSAIVRLTLAAICGGIIGIERGRKHRPAGMRTHMLVCLGATLTVLISQYLWAVLGQTTDMSRFGAQVISGIGFLGAGTIIVTGRQQIKGLTTAAGLWASACMGLAIGAGFYEGALLGGLMILITTTLLSRFELYIMSTARNMNIFVEFSSPDDIGMIIETVKKMNIKIFDVEITKIRATEGLYPSAIYSIRLPKKKRHTEVLTAIAKIEGVRTVEEL